jgi:hypothetical protein
VQGCGVCCVDKKDEWCVEVFNDVDCFFYCDKDEIGNSPERQRQNNYDGYEVF